MKTVTLIDGKLVSRKNAVVSVFDNALLYSEGLFETCLAVDGKILFPKLHFRRLREGSKLIGLKSPAGDRKILEWMQRAAKLHSSRITKVRLTVTSGESARWVGKQGKPRIIVSASPHAIPSKAFTLHLSPIHIESKSLFRRIKTISYVVHAAAIRKALKLGCDDALMANEHGNVAEVTSANIFWVNKGKLYTPPLSAGCLDGVTRRIVIREARKLRIPFAEKNLPVAQLVTADEVFISSSLKLVVPVGSIRVGSKTIRCSYGEVTDRLREQFLRLAGV